MVAVLFLIFPISDVSLSLQVPCTVNLEEGVAYHIVTWYKVSVGNGSMAGLVRKDLRTNTTQLYKFANHSYKIGNDLSLLHVPEQNQKECEIYRCCVWPPVGHRILQSDFSLPQGCQSNAVGKTEFSSQVQGTHTSQYAILAGVLLVVILCIAGFVCVYNRRKTHSKVPVHVAI
ncbi:uncharacterized protein Hap1MRO34_011866 isoform 2-T2 [Clarias gariepinus]